MACNPCAPQSADENAAVPSSPPSPPAAWSCFCFWCRTALVLYRQILDAIEANDFNNFTQRAYVPKWRKLLSLPVAYARASVQLPMPPKS